MPTAATENPMFINITHAGSGANATVSLTGATVKSFVTAGGKEVIFCSRLAKLDGSKAIRGGIPLCFPQFGQPDKSMPQHGFLRANQWKQGKSYEDEATGAAVCEFVLTLTDDMRDRGGKWAPGGEYKCEAIYCVKVEAEKLTTTLTVTNTGDETIDGQQALFHTYYAIEGKKAMDKDVCNVKGLKGYSVVDKSPGEGEPAKFTQEDELVFVYKEIDRIYSNSVKPDLDLMISTGLNSKVKLEASGKVNGESAATSVVVWNPYIEKAKSLGDFGDEQYHEMLCVEPGLLNNDPLSPGNTMVFEQVITAL
mmetsp:Transcript_20939/g.31922  ORF Transcript_20939/g.31922 Transcript_20939/m.31922 type:complete len:309 (-) Transcript_20939:207-1133(-)